MDLLNVAHLWEGAVITERHEEDAMVCEGRKGGHGGDFLTTTKRRSGNEDSSVFATKGAGCPEVSGSVPEGL